MPDRKEINKRGYLKEDFRLFHLLFRPPEHPPGHPSAVEPGAAPDEAGPVLQVFYHT